MKMTFFIAFTARRNMYFKYRYRHECKSTKFSSTPWFAGLDIMNQSYSVQYGSMASVAADPPAVAGYWFTIQILSGNDA